MLRVGALLSVLEVRLKRSMTGPFAEEGVCCAAGPSTQYLRTLVLTANQRLLKDRPKTIKSMVVGTQSLDSGP